MARNRRRPEPTSHRVLQPLRHRCWVCDGSLWLTYTNRRTLMTLSGLLRLSLKIRRCQNPSCPRYHTPYRPEEEGSLALPHGEFGLDVIAFVGHRRFAHHQRVSEIHQELCRRDLGISPRTVTNLLYRYEELVALHRADPARLAPRFTRQGRAILALDGLQPDVGHEVLWVVREVLSGELLLAKSLLSATQDDLAALLREVKRRVPVPIAGVISDGQHSIRNAVAVALPGVPHPLCQFHYLREAAQPIYEADRHAKKELKKRVRDVRPIERALEGRHDPEAAALRGYCLAVRSALTDDGQPPLCASGLKLHDRLEALRASIERVAAKSGSLPS